MLLKIGILFILVGLWHGFTLTYFFYVMTAYLFLSLDILTKKIRSNLFLSLNINTDSFLFRITNYLAIIFMFCSFELFIKSPNINYASYFLKNIGFFHFYKFGLINLLIMLIYIIIFESLQTLQKSPFGSCFDSVKSINLRMILALFLIFSIIIFSSREAVTFQYFQF